MSNYQTPQIIRTDLIGNNFEEMRYEDYVETARDDRGRFHYLGLYISGIKLAGPDAQKMIRTGSNQLM